MRYKDNILSIIRRQRSCYQYGFFLITISRGGIADVVMRFIHQPKSQTQSVLLFVLATEARYVALIGGLTSTGIRVNVQF